MNRWTSDTSTSGRQQTQYGSGSNASTPVTHESANRYEWPQRQRQLATTSSYTSYASSYDQRFVDSTRRPITRQPLYDHMWNTTATTSALVTSDGHRSTTIMAITEGRGRAKEAVGLAVIDVHNPVLVLSQFNDNYDYECLRIKCDVYRPVEVIVPNSLNADNRLLKILKQCLTNTYIKTVDRKLFNETIGQELIRNLCCDDYKTVDMELKNQYYCLSSAAALIKYIETFEHLMYANRSVRIRFEGSEQTMAIDPTTAKLLELIVNLNNPKSDHTLFGVLNKTKTRCGYRLLRANVLQPSTDQSLIEKRLDMIEEIISSQTMFLNLESLLSQFTAIEVERIISCLVQTSRSIESSKLAERKIEAIIIVKHMISLIDKLVQTLNDCDNHLVFGDLIRQLNDNRFQLIMDEINEVIDATCKYVKDSQNMRLEKCHAIKRGHNRLLDIARQTYSENIDDISYLIQQYAENTSLPLKTVYTTSRGFHMQITGKDVQQMNFDIPRPFIRIHSSKTSIGFTTQDIIHKNNRTKTAVQEIYLMSEAIISDLIVKLRAHIGCLYNLSEVLAKVDLVFSLAYQCSVGNYVRPKFDGHLVIKQGRHPILEKILKTKPVANETFMSDDQNLMIITGPNMSGKTTYLKQVAIHQVMAQIGSYIPAEVASFTICDKLFSRIGNNDDIETNSSTFMVEMREISHILHNTTEDSLIIIDELGRGTSVEEGVGLCLAICEHLLQTKAFTLLATHFIELTKLEDFYFNVSNFHFGVEHPVINDLNTNSYTFTHILESGATREQSYGLQLAKMTAIHPNIIHNAQIYAQQLINIYNKPIIARETDLIKRAKYRLISLIKAQSIDGQIPAVDELKKLIYDYNNGIQCGVQSDSEGLEIDFHF